MPYGITRPKWVNSFQPKGTYFHIFMPMAYLCVHEQGTELLVYQLVYFILSHYQNQYFLVICKTLLNRPISQIPQCTIQNRNVHISVLKSVLWDMEQVHCRICELDQLYLMEMWLKFRHYIQENHMGVIFSAIGILVWIPGMSEYLWCQACSGRYPCHNRYPGVIPEGSCELGQYCWNYPHSQPDGVLTFDRWEIN